MFESKYVYSVWAWREPTQKNLRTNNIYNIKKLLANSMNETLSGYRNTAITGML